MGTMSVTAIRMGIIAVAMIINGNRNRSRHGTYKSTGTLDHADSSFTATSTVTFLLLLVLCFHIANTMSATTLLLAALTCDRCCSESNVGCYIVRS